MFDFNSRTQGHWKSCPYSTHSPPAAQIKVDALLCLLLHLKDKPKPSFSQSSFVDISPSPSTEQRCSVSSSTNVTQDFSHGRTQKQVALSGVPQVTLTRSLTDLSHLQSLPSHGDTAMCQLQAAEMSSTTGTLETIRSVKFSP